MYNLGSSSNPSYYTSAATAAASSSPITEPQRPCPPQPIISAYNSTAQVATKVLSPPNSPSSITAATALSPQPYPKKQLYSELEKECTYHPYSDAPDGDFISSYIDRTSHNNVFIGQLPLWLKKDQLIAILKRLNLRPDAIDFLPSSNSNCRCCLATFNDPTAQNQARRLDYCILPDLHGYWINEKRIPAISKKMSCLAHRHSGAYNLPSNPITFQPSNRKNRECNLYVRTTQVATRFLATEPAPEMQLQSEMANSFATPTIVLSQPRSSCLHSSNITPASATGTIPLPPILPPGRKFSDDEQGRQLTWRLLNKLMGREESQEDELQAPHSNFMEEAASFQIAPQSKPKRNSRMSSLAHAFLLPPSITTAAPQPTTTAASQLTLPAPESLDPKPENLSSWIFCPYPEPIDDFYIPRSNSAFKEQTLFFGQLPNPITRAGFLALLNQFDLYPNLLRIQASPFGLGTCGYAAFNDSEQHAKALSLNKKIRFYWNGFYHNTAPGNSDVTSTNIFSQKIDSTVNQSPQNVRPLFLVVEPARQREYL